MYICGMKLYPYIISYKKKMKKYSKKLAYIKKKYYLCTIEIKH